MGINPSVGESVCLDLYDSNQKKLCNKTFTISGIFESSDNGAYGGDVRYPDIVYE